MLTHKQVFEIVDGVTYKNWRVEVLRDSFEPTSPLKLAWVAEVTCSKTGNPIVLTSSAIRIDHRFDERMLLREIRRTLHELVTHEADEFFRYNGVMIFDPHYGEIGYEPERTVNTRQASLSRNPRRAFVPITYRGEPIRMGGDEGVYEIDPADYTRFR